MKLTPAVARELADGAELEAISKLNASNKDIDSIAGLDSLPSLTRLDLSGNSLSDASPIGAAPRLRWLNVSSNAIPDLSPLSGAVEDLEVLNVGKNALSGAVSVGKFRALKALIANDNAIESLPGLEKLQQLNTLVLSRNRIVSGSWLKPSKSLRKLNLSSNDFGSVEAVKSLGNAFEHLPELRELRLSHCGLPTLPPGVSKLRFLLTLEAGGNGFASLDDLAPLRDLPLLRVLNLRGCPVTELPAYQQTVRAMLPNLRSLDAGPREPKRERDAQEGEGEEGAKAEEKKRTEGKRERGGRTPWRGGAEGRTQGKGEGKRDAEKRHGKAPREGGEKRGEEKRHGKAPREGGEKRGEETRHGKAPREKREERSGGAPISGDRASEPGPSGREGKKRSRDRAAPAVSAFELVAREKKRGKGSAPAAPSAPSSATDERDDADDALLLAGSKGGKKRGKKGAKREADAKPDASLTGVVKVSAPKPSGKKEKAGKVVTGSAALDALLNGGGDGPGGWE